MSRFDTLTADQHKDLFLNTLTDVQAELERKGIDYRIIGSLASHAYLGTCSEPIDPLNYDRPGAATPDQVVPDIDLIVPRADLAGAREIRSNALHIRYPVKLGLANPTTDIDFRPGEDQSFLTHKNIALPVDNDLLRVEDDVTLDGHPIQTVPLDTLIHTYGTFGGHIRKKDMPVLKALIKQDIGLSDPRTAVFHEFQKQRRQASPGEYYLSQGIELAESKMPRIVRNELYRAALVAASLLGKR